MNKSIFFIGLPHGADKFIYERTAASIIANTPYVTGVYYHNHTQVWDAGLKGSTFETTMKAVITTMLQCDELHLFGCWKDDRKAQILRDIAIRLNMTIVHY